MSNHSSLLLLLVTLWASVQDGLGLPVVKQAEVDAGDSVPTHHVRTKRCACSNALDSECHYFCHLDIIWVNTPGKTTVYGLGSALLRRRRAAGRCTCANLEDQTCTGFCHLNADIKYPKSRQLDVVGILRAPAERSRSAGGARRSERDESPGEERKIV